MTRIVGKVHPGVRTVRVAKQLKMGTIATLLCAVGPVAGCGRVDVVGRVEDDAGGVGQDGVGQDDAANAPRPAAGCQGAARVLSQALCACGTTSVTGGLETETFHGDAAAHVRVGGPLLLSGQSGEIDGDLVIGDGGASVIESDDGTVAGNLLAAGELGVQGTLSVAQDATLGTPLFGEGTVAVAGDLSSPLPQIVTASSATLVVDGETRTAPLSPAPVCACGDDALDIAGFVAAIGDDHDNAEADFDPTSLLELSPDATVSLPEGRLWALAVNAAGDLTLEVKGKTTLMVPGDLRVSGTLRAKLGKKGELTIFVAGSASLAGPPSLGEPMRPGAARLYVAGPMVVGGLPAEREAPEKDGKQWVGNLYAPQLSLHLSGKTRVTGALHVAELTALGGIHSTHDPALASVVEDCGDR